MAKSKEQKPKENKEKIPINRKMEIHRVGEIIPFAKYSDENECFVMTDGSCLSILKIRCKDLWAINGTDREYDYQSLAKFERLMPKDHKIVCLNVPTDTVKQQMYLQRKIEKCENSFIRRQLSVKLSEEEAIMRNRSDKQFFLFIYSAGEDDARRQEQTAFEALRPARMIEKISKEKKIELIDRLYNKPAEAQRGDDE